MSGCDCRRGKRGYTGTNGVAGADGLSAYEIAVENGFIGTEQEWLDLQLENFANTNLTFTANRNHDLDGYELKLNGTVKTVSPSASSLDTAFGVRAFGDATNLFQIQGNGLAQLGGTNIDTSYTFKINGDIGSFGALYAKRNGTGITIYSEGGSYNEARTQTVAGWFGEATSGSGIWGRCTTGIGVKAEATNSLGFALSTIGRIQTSGIADYINDAAAAAGSPVVQLGEVYFNTVLGALTIRKV